MLDCLDSLSDLAAGRQHWAGDKWLDNDPGDAFNEGILWVPPDLDAFRRRLAKLLAITVQDAWDHRHCFKVGCRNESYNLEDWAPSSADIRTSLRGLFLIRWTVLTIVRSI